VVKLYEYRRAFHLLGYEGVTLNLLFAKVFGKGRKGEKEKAVASSTY